MAERWPTNTRRPRSRLSDALQVLGPAEPALHAKRGAGDQHRVGRVRPGRPRAHDQCRQQVRAVAHRRLTRPAGRRWPAGRARARPGRGRPGSGAPRKMRAAARRTSSMVTALILATVSAVGIMRPNTCICRASCSQRLPVLSSDISRPAFTWARARSQLLLGHAAPAPCAAPPASPGPAPPPRARRCRRRCRTGRHPAYGAVKE